MADLGSLDRVADLLPASHKEAFLRLATKLRDVPEDDEYLVILEAMGFMSLILREIPERVREVLSSASPASNLVAQDTVGHVARRIVEGVVEHLSQPTFQDLKRAFSDLQASQESLKLALQHSVAGLRQIRHPALKLAGWLIACVILILALSTWLWRLPPVETIGDEYRALATLVESMPNGRLEVSPEVGFSVSGEFSEAFITDGGDAVVILQPNSP
tara:strand:- start:6 stop:656 length:651 start_codon:yes stop_codon:yes gene_type:complete